MSLALALFLAFLALSAVLSAATAPHAAPEAAPELEEGPALVLTLYRAGQAPLTLAEAPDALTCGRVAEELRADYAARGTAGRVACEAAAPVDLTPYAEEGDAFAPELEDSRAFALVLRAIPGDAESGPVHVFELDSGLTLQDCEEARDLFAPYTLGTDSLGVACELEGPAL